MCMLYMADMADTAVSWDTLPEPYKYRDRYWQKTIGQSEGSPIEELEKGLKELKGIATNQSLKGSQGLSH